MLLVRGRGVTFNRLVMAVLGLGAICTMLKIIISSSQLEYHGRTALVKPRYSIGQADKDANATSNQGTTISEEIDTSIIILSSLIPTHPNMKMLNDTFNSLPVMLDGLPFSKTPTFISVDGLPEKKLTSENLAKLQGYIEHLRLRFRDYPNVFILNNYEHGHINHSIRRALELVRTRFVYVLQHDFKFIKHVNHTALVKSMREHPGELQIVRFGKDNQSKSVETALMCFVFSRMALSKVTFFRKMLRSIM